VLFVRRDRLDTTVRIPYNSPEQTKAKQGAGMRNDGWPIPHTFTVTSSTARLLLLNAPGGFERMFELAPQTADEAVPALRQYGVEVVGPHRRDEASA
jgi:hypothetical protein